jgi:hypothetical protein
MKVELLVNKKCKGSIIEKTSLNSSKCNKLQEQMLVQQLELMLQEQIKLD